MFSFLFWKWNSKHLPRYFDTRIAQKLTIDENLHWICTFLGDASNDRELLKWVKRQFESDDIEDVNAVVVDKIARGEVGHKSVYGNLNIAAVLFCKLKYFYRVTFCIPTFSILDKQGDAVSGKILKSMENIDDECDQQGIILVKVWWFIQKVFE